MADPVPSSPSPQAGSFVLAGWSAPNLEAGHYRITVTHAIANVPGASVPQASRDFIVEAPRLALSQDDVYASYPLAGSVGDFHLTLPHVVLNRRTLPWVRQALPGARAPWMALLVFAEDELEAGDAGAQTRTATTTGAQLAVAEPGVLKPVLADATPFDQARNVETIRFAAALVPDILPTPDEVRALAHIRQVNLSGQSGEVLIEDSDGDGWFAIVVANRLPLSAPASAGPRRNIVHLVSLEGLGDMVANGSAGDYRTVCMVSLFSWSFECVASGSDESFKGLAAGLVGNGTATADSLLLRVPLPAATAAGGADKAVRDRLRQGYVPLAWHARSGEDAPAWYRGPLTPVRPRPVIYKEPVITGDSLIIYDQANGMFDHSLAAAWQIGRVLGLADPNYAASLVRLRRRASRTLDNRAASQRRLALTASILPQAAAGQSFGRASLNAIFDTGALGALALGPTADGLQSLSGGMLGMARMAAALPLVQAMAALAAEPAPAPAEDPEADLMTAVANRLVRLITLRDVPFNYLLPDCRVGTGLALDQQMLPAESLRFFHVDRNWLRALVNGALSIGLWSERDTTVDATIRDRVWQAVGGQVQPAHHWHLLSAVGAPNPVDDAPPPITGMLMRSRLVTGFPGLTIAATAAGGDVPILRLDRMGEDVLLVLFLGLPDRLNISQPQQNLHFGVADDGKIMVRAVSGPVGQPQGGSLSVSSRGGRAGAALDVVGLVSAVRGVLNVASLDSGGVALQLLRPAVKLSISRE